MGPKLCQVRVHVSEQRWVGHKLCLVGQDCVKWGHRTVSVSTRTVSGKNRVALMGHGILTVLYTTYVCTCIWRRIVKVPHAWNVHVISQQRVLLYMSQSQCHNCLLNRVCCTEVTQTTVSLLLTPLTTKRCPVLSAEAWCRRETDWR